MSTMRSELHLAGEADTAERAVITLIRSIGEDPARDGLLETPRRVVEALREMTY